MYFISMQLFCLIVLVCAIISIPAIDEYNYDSAQGDFADNMNSYLGIAGWLVFASFTTVTVNVVMKVFRILYLCSVVKRRFVSYAITVSVVINI